MKSVGLTLACLLLLTPFMLLTASAVSTLSVEWQRNSGFDLSTGINGEYTITAHPASNLTTHIDFYLDDKLQYSSTQTPYSWTFHTDSYPEGEHTIRIAAYTSTGETAAATETRNFTGFPYMFIVGVLLFASIVLAFALLLTWYLIKKKANAKRTASKTVGTTTQPNER
jgi:hypothetical protein